MKGPARTALDAMLKRGDVRMQEQTIPGMGTVRIENVMGQRFGFLEGHVCPMTQLRRDADAVDTGKPTSHQQAVADLAAIERAVAEGRS